MTQKRGFSIRSEVEPIKPRPFFGVIYGLPGVGKTSLGFTMPNVLHIDADRGLERAVQKMRPQSAEVTEYGDFFDYIMSRDFEEYVRMQGIESILLDTVGTLLDDLVAPWLIRVDAKNGNNSGGLALPGWGALKSNFGVLKNRFQSLGLHTLCICHAKEEGESNSRRFELAVSGGSADIIYRTSDLIGLMTVQGTKRILNFNPTNFNIGKNVGNLPVYTIPDATSDEYDNFFTNILKAVSAKMTEQSEKQVAFKKDLETWKDLLDSRVTTDDFDQFMKDVAKLPDGLLKTSIKTLIRAKLVEKNYKYDIDLKKVVDMNQQSETTENEAINEED